MSQRWGLIVEEMRGTYTHSCSATVLEHFLGTREDALARLEERARSYQARHPLNPVRTRLFRTGEGFLLVNDGDTHGFGCRFSVAELLCDSAEEKEAAAAAREAERQQRAALKQAEKEAKRAQRKSRRGL
ncbi:hypothetical protein [Streptomyces malaysiense]|uniref:Uncharacterized protein n=1 Tax=Streptomyces malaysiense TaxID=1428626 RepID=A0A1J4PV82_9ACTN|nr:hypothetical protein [Streptomyces malaysiense]OIK24673.1 hypothetical protein VT52_026230 [Streptomyces malaysiense]